MRFSGLTVLVLALLHGGCSEEGVRSSPMDRGIKALESGFSTEAERAFGEVLAADPMNAPAALGRALARTMWLFDLGDWIGMLALRQNETYPKLSASRPLFAMYHDAVLASFRSSGDSPSMGAIRDENEFFHAYISGSLAGILTLLEETERDLAVAAQSPDPLLTLDRYSLKIGGREMADLGGTWRSADVKIFSALVSLFTNAFRLVLSQDLKTDYVGLLAYANQTVLRALDEAREGENTTGTAGLLNLVAYLLTRPEYPNFLGSSTSDLDGNGVPDGFEMVERIGLSIQTSLTDFGDALRDLSLAEASDTPRPFAFSALSEGSLDGTLTFGSDLKHFSVRTTPGFESSLETLLSHLGGHNPAQLSVRDHLAPLLAFAASAALQSGLIPLGDAPPALDTSLLESLIRGALATDVALDLKTFFSRPISIQLWLPPARSDLEPEENNFLFEWECPSITTVGAVIGTTSAFPGKGDLTCGSGVEIIDADHFTDPIFGVFGVSSVPADGISSGFPYVPFPDATLAGLLYLDSGSGMEPATSATLNTLIAQVGGLVAPLLSPARP